MIITAFQLKLYIDGLTEEKRRKWLETLAQSLPKQLFRNQQVRGSNPRAGTNKINGLDEKRFPVSRHRKHRGSAGAKLFRRAVVAASFLLTVPAHADPLGRAGLIGGDTPSSAPSRGEAAPSAGCRIKGNISKGERIYHALGTQDYERIEINPAKGERWFCSEAEARAAGWRPSSDWAIRLN